MSAFGFDPSIRYSTGDAGSTDLTTTLKIEVYDEATALRIYKMGVKEGLFVNCSINREYDYHFYRGSKCELTFEHVCGMKALFRLTQIIQEAVMIVKAEEHAARMYED